jgi:hypothetical protein
LAEIDYGEGLIVGKTLFFLKAEWNWASKRLPFQTMHASGASQVRVWTIIDCVGRRATFAPENPFFGDAISI